MVEHLWDHVDTTLATAPNYVRKILTDLVVLHCYHSCDPTNVKVNSWRVHTLTTTSHYFAPNDS